MERISKSKMVCLFNCPMNYYFKYMNRAKKTDIVDDKFIVAGIEVHEKIEKVYDKIDDSIMDEEGHVQIFLLNQAFGEPVTKIPESIEIIKTARDNFVDWQLDMNEKVGGFYRPYDVEKFVKCVIDQEFIDKFVGDRKGSNAEKIRNMSPLDQPYLVNGFIDRVDLINGEYSIMDYKSKTKSVKAWELALYSLMASIDLKYDISHVSCWGYKDASYYYRKLKINNIDFALYKILEYNKLVNRYKRMGFKKKESKWICEWCEYKQLCQKTNKKETIMGED